MPIGLDFSSDYSENEQSGIILLAVRSQHCFSSGCLRVPGTMLHATSRWSLAPHQAAYWVQKVHDCSLLSVLWSNTFFGRPHQTITPAAAAARACMHSSAEHVWLCRSECHVGLISLGGRSFAVAVPRAWNNLLSSSFCWHFQFFGRHLKTFYL